MNLLARREHSRVELARKLARYVSAETDSDAAASEIDAVLDALERDNLLSNARFAEALAYARAGRHGSLRLRADLLNKGVSAALVAEQVGAAREQDLATARMVWQKKFPTPPANPVERARQMRFLASRGFPAEVVRRVVGGQDDD
jgi:regulatory protein